MSRSHLASFLSSSCLTLALVLLAAPQALAAWTLIKSAPLPAPDGLKFREAQVADGAASAAVYQVSFAPKTHAFAVMDNPDGAFDLGSACVKRGALAGVNGGYFQPDRTPLGLVVRQGMQIHPLEKTRLLSGVISVTPSAITIQRTAAFKASPAVREALQAGPFLVEGGKAIVGLNTTKTAARTVVFQDASGRAGVLICKSVSLAEMGEILATPELFPEGRIIRALNLDGGSSTALWVRGEPPFYQREWKAVRNYLAIVARR
jgi:exopolysaccharide biosynthesis protein